MAFDADRILAVLDRCCDQFTFPMLDNGYFYLAATRLSLFRSSADWAMVFEVFCFSPRAGLPNTFIETFASALCNRDIPEEYGRGELYERYLAAHLNDDCRPIYPIDPGDWQDEEDGDFLAEGATEFILRGQRHPMPSSGACAERGIVLGQPPRVRVFEFCRYVADVARELILATPEERRLSVLPEMVQLLQLEEWHHPNVVEKAARPSGNETFHQLAQVLVTGDVSQYRPTQPPNTHWRNWPDGGSL
jgi:hypothetical protein